MKYNSEAAVLDALEMQSWRNLSKEKFFQFFAMMPDIHNEVALRLIGQLPEFVRFAGAALDDALDTYRAALSANDRSMEMANLVGLERLAVLRTELDRYLSPEERKRVLDDIRDVHERAIERDAENKRFLDQQVTKLVGAAFSTVIAALVFVGARVMFQSGGVRGIAA